MSVTLSLPSIKGEKLLHTEMESNLTDLRDAVNIAKLETVVTTEAIHTAGIKQVILMDATASNKVVQLPDVSLSLDLVYVVKKTDPSTNFVTISGFGGDLIENSTNHVLQVQGEAVTVICNSTGWAIISHEANHPRVVGLKVDTTTVTNTVVETVIYSHLFPANTFDSIGEVVATVSGEYSNVSPNTDFDIIIKMNGVTVHTLNRIGTGKVSSGWKVKMSGTIRTIGASGTYIDIAGLSDGDNTFTKASTNEVSIDTTSTLLYEVYVKWGSADVANVFNCTQGKIIVGVG